LGGLGRYAFLRRGAECEQEEEEKTGMQKELERFHGRWAPPGGGMDVDLQLGDCSRNPSRAVLEITESFVSDPAW